MSIIWNIQRRASGEWVPAEIISPASFDVLVEIEEAWSSSRSQLDSSEREHLHWNWADKASLLRSETHRECVAVRADGRFQGIMMCVIRRSDYPARLQPSAQLVYADYVEAAPSNLTAAGQFGGVGSLLLAIAVERSIAERLAGRVGLHSLPTAEGFYRGLGMTDLGPDAGYNGLNYFEFEIEPAVRFLLKRIKDG